MKLDAMLFKFGQGSAGVSKFVGALHSDSGVVTYTANGVVVSLFKTLDARRVRFCHWKSNIRISDTLSGAEDIDLLVHRGDAAMFQTIIQEHGFKMALSKTGLGHPGVFHALSLDQDKGELLHLHAYHQIVSGDSLVKNYRFPVDQALLENTRLLQGARVPSAEMELVLFALRIALKHVSPVEIAMVNRGYGKISQEMKWLRKAAQQDKSAVLVAELFPAIEPAFFIRLLDAIEKDDALLRRIYLGWQMAWRLRDLRRLGYVNEGLARLRRVCVLLFGRVWHRKDMTLQTGGMIVALVGPKATGKSTLGRELASRLGLYLDVRLIHSGKPPATALTALLHVFIPLARRLFQSERPREYEKPGRRQDKTYSIIYVLHMTMLAYERHRLLRQASRIAAAGGIVVSDRYPSASTGAIDSSCFDDVAVAKCKSPIKRWLMNVERSLYQRMPKPNLILRLVAPIEKSIERDADRTKPGGPDADAVHRRWDMETNAEFLGVNEVEIDTNRALDETVRDVVNSVWKAL